MLLLQAQRLMLKDSRVAHLALPPDPAAMPNITAGSPTHVSND